ncbi:MAG: ParB/RepB/Spo0J family partition protein [SAR324 cluster bacterium]
MGRRKKPLRHLQNLDCASLELPANDADAGAADIAALAESFAAGGQQEPILVTESATPGMWRVIVGTRRLRAARALGWPTIAAIVLPAALQAEIGTIERLQAGQVDPFALADTLQRLKTACAWTQTHLGHAIGKNRDFVANILAITQIDPAVRKYIVENSNGNALTARHLRYIARTPPAGQLALAEEIIKHGRSTKNLERRKHSESLRTPRPEFIRVRDLRRAGTPQAPETPKEWRRYYRQLTTDLRRLDRQEQRESRRVLDLLDTARLRRRQVKHEASRKRRALARELKQARRHLEQGGTA